MVKMGGKLAGASGGYRASSAGSYDLGRARRYYIGDKPEKEDDLALGAEIQRLSVKKGDGYHDAINRLVEGNLRLVPHIIKSYYGDVYQGTSVSFEDLVGEGNVGLMIAAERFDPSMGNKFSSYAVCWINNRILKYLSDNIGAVRIPRRQMDKIIRLVGVQRILANELGRYPTIEETAKRAGIPVRKAEETFSLCAEPVPMQDTHPTRYHRKSQRSYRNLWGNFLDGDSPDNPEERLFFEEMTVQVREALEKLPSMEKRVLVERFVNEKTQKEVGISEGLSHGRISQIESEAKAKAREELEAIY